MNYVKWINDESDKANEKKEEQETEENKLVYDSDILVERPIGEWGDRTIIRPSIPITADTTINGKNIIEWTAKIQELQDKVKELNKDLMMRSWELANAIDRLDDEKMPKAAMFKEED